MKDLRVEETPAVKENKPPQVPNDPAILGVSATANSVIELDFGLVPCSCDEIFRMLTHIVSESAKPCGDFRCLPSELHIIYTTLLKSFVGSFADMVYTEWYTSYASITTSAATKTTSSSSQ